MILISTRQLPRAQNVQRISFGSVSSHDETIGGVFFFLHELAVYLIN